MAEIAVDNRANLIIADIISVIKNATVSGVVQFADALSVNDVESFIRVSDPMRSDGRAICGIVEGSIERRTGGNSDQESVCRLPFEILIRFEHLRDPGEGEKPAMERAKRYAGIIANALIQDRGRNGNADLVQWGGEVINGTTVNGNTRPLTKFANEAFFTASMSGASCWINYRE